MAERRMFAKSVVSSGRFIQMPASSQNLYFHLGVNADDDGVVEALMVMRAISATEDDLRILVHKGYVRILNQDLAVYITDWNVNNYIRSDRYREGAYHDLVVEILSDNQLSTNCLPDDNQATTNGIPSIGKDRLGKASEAKDSIGKGNNTSFAVSEESEPAVEIFISLPLKVGQGEFHVDVLYLSRLKELYPAVDVEQELRNMYGWCDANPKNRKTRSGIKRFITNWLSREQNRARPQAGKTSGDRYQTAADYMESTKGWYTNDN